jgi:hypothetical protein
MACRLCASIHRSMLKPVLGTSASGTAFRYQGGLVLGLVFQYAQ